MKKKNGFRGERAVVLPRIITGRMAEDPLAGVLYITDMGYYPRAMHHFRERSEPIAQYVFIYCVDGEGWYELHGVRHSVKRDEFFILPAGVPHAYGASERNPWTIYWVHFSGTLAGEYASHASSPQRVAPGVTSRISNRINLFEEIFAILAGEDLSLAGIRYAMAVFNHYLASLRFLKEYRRSGASAQDGELSLEEDIVKATIHFLGENIERRLTLDEIADFSGYSASRLSALFKERTGHSPITYFNLMKVRRGCDMLDHTKMKLNQISYKLGIEDPFYFSRMFTKIMGMSPKAYRERQKG